MGLHRVFLLFPEEGVVAFNYIKAAMTLPYLETNKCSRDVKGRGCWSIWGKVLDLKVAWPKRAAICPAAGAQQTFTECIYEGALCFPANDTLSLIWRRGHLWKWCRGHLWKTPLRISHFLGPRRENKGAQMTWQIDSSIWREHLGERPKQAWILGKCGFLLGWPPSSSSFLLKINPLMLLNFNNKVCILKIHEMVFKDRRTLWSD